MTPTIERAYTTIDKTMWGAPRGPWDAEPDKVQWTDASTGLPCLAVRHSSSGHWCGYVGVAEGHPAYGKSYDDVRTVNNEWIEVHGGLTYSDTCMSGPEDKSICHVPQHGKPDHVWWLGFDCAHSGDLSPGYAFKVRLNPYEQYRDLPYVQVECASLARQLAALA